LFSINHLHQTLVQHTIRAFINGALFKVTALAQPEVWSGCCCPLLPLDFMKRPCKRPAGFAEDVLQT
jgi:hypothetical protein